MRAERVGKVLLSSRHDEPFRGPAELADLYLHNGSDLTIQGLGTVSCLHEARGATFVECRPAWSDPLSDASTRRRARS